jgi:uncharacterized protein (TIGR00251 family)
MTELKVKVVPGARRTEVVGRHGDGIKVRVAVPPEGGRANDAMIEVLAEKLGVKPGALRIVRGRTSPQKVVEVDGLGAKEVWDRIGD